MPDFTNSYPLGMGPVGPLSGISPDDPDAPVLNQVGGSSDDDDALGGGTGTKKTQIVSINGRQVLIDSATGRPIADLGPSPTSAPPTREVGGVLYERGPNGWVPAAGLPSTGSVGPTPYQNAQLDETIRVNTAQIERWAREDAQKAQDSEYLKTKDAWAQRNGDAKLALATQGQIASIQAQRETLNFNIQQAQQRSAEMQQQMSMQVDQFNSTQRLNVDRANNEAADRKAGRLQQINTDIGVLGQDTGNRGRFATFATAASPWSGKSTGGVDLIDEQSAMPLTNALQSRESTMAQPDRPFSFTPLVFNPLNTSYGNTQDPDGGRRNTTEPGALSAQAAAMQAAMNRNAGVTDPDDKLTSAELAALIGGDKSVLNDTSYAGAAGLPKMEQGGMVHGMYLSGDSSDGEENPEVNIPLGNGDAIVISMKGMPPEKIKQTKARLQKFATGGLFSNLADGSLTKNFLIEASKKGRAGTPWENGALPTPVYESSPGFDPDVASLLDSLRALDQGIPTSYSRRLSAMYRPAGMGQRVIGRSA